MLVVASSDAHKIGEYWRLHTTCAVQWVVDAGLDVPEHTDLRAVLPEAADLIVMTHDHKDSLWASVEGACIRCGEGDSSDGSTEGDRPRAE